MTEKGLVGEIGSVGGFSNSPRERLKWPDQDGQARAVRSVPNLDIFAGKTSEADFDRRDKGCGKKRAIEI